MWHCSNKPQKSRAHGCKQIFSFTQMLTHSCTYTKTHTHSYAPIPCYSASFHLTPVLQAPMILISLFWFQCHTDPISLLHTLLLSPSLSFSFSSISYSFASLHLNFPFFPSHSDVFISLTATSKLCLTNANPFLSQKRPPVEESSPPSLDIPHGCIFLLYQRGVVCLKVTCENCWIEDYTCACALMRQSKESLSEIRVRNRSIAK